MAAAVRPRILWVALGDPDEYAHRGDRRGYDAALAAADRLLARLVATVGLDDAVVFVTADHGRAANFRDHGDAPESSGVWLVAAGAGIPRAGFVRTRALHRLADIAPTLRALVHARADGSARAGRPIEELLAGAGLVATARQAFSDSDGGARRSRSVVSASMSTGLTRCASKPASRARWRSASWP